MANDMGGKFIAFDEISSLDKLMALPMPKINSSDLFYFPKTGKIGKLSEAKSKYEEMTCTIDLAQVAPDSIDPNEIYKIMQEMMRHKEEMLYSRQRERMDPNIKAHEILKTSDHWCQRNLYEFRSSGIRAMCMLGAILAKYGLTNGDDPHPGYREDYNKVANLIVRKYPGSYKRDIKNIIASWNDEPGRRFEEVQEILKEANV